MKENIYITFNIIGLVLDLIGFIGIYNTKLKPIPKIETNIQNWGKHMVGDNNLRKFIPDILKSINNKLETINSNHKRQDEKTLKYFGIVIIGIVFQVVSNIISLL